MRHLMAPFGDTKSRDRNRFYCLHLVVNLMTPLQDPSVMGQHEMLQLQPGT